MNYIDKMKIKKKYNYKILIIKILESQICSFFVITY